MRVILRCSVQWHYKVLFHILFARITGSDKQFFRKMTIYTEQTYSPSVIALSPLEIFKSITAIQKWLSLLTSQLSVSRSKSDMTAAIFWNQI